MISNDGYYTYYDENGNMTERYNNNFHTIIDYDYYDDGQLKSMNIHRHRNEECGSVVEEVSPSENIVTTTIPWFEKE